MALQRPPSAVLDRSVAFVTCATAVDVALVIDVYYWQLLSRMHVLIWCLVSILRLWGFHCGRHCGLLSFFAVYILLHDLCPTGMVLLRAGLFFAYPAFGKVGILKRPASYSRQPTEAKPGHCVRGDLLVAEAEQFISDTGRYLVRSNQPETEAQRQETSLKNRLEKWWLRFSDAQRSTLLALQKPAAEKIDALMLELRALVDENG